MKRVCSFYTRPSPPNSPRKMSKRLNFCLHVSLTPCHLAPACIKTVVQQIRGYLALNRWAFPIDEPYYHEQYSSMYIENTRKPYLVTGEQPRLHGFLEGRRQ